MSYVTKMNEQEMKNRNFQLAVRNKENEVFVELFV